MNKIDELVIEKGIPLPPRRLSSILVRTLLSKMEVGDSVLLANLTKSVDTTTQPYYNAARYLGIRVTYRKVEGGVRIWRVK